MKSNNNELPEESGTDYTGDSCESSIDDDTTSNADMLEEAAQHLSFLPLKTDGSKAPAGNSWKHFQAYRAAPEEVVTWRSDGKGLGIIGGEISGHLEIIDIDKAYLLPLYFAQVEALGLSELIKRLVVSQTPDGYHLFYRCFAGVGGNEKLAMKADNKTVLIETRGEGGYVVSPFSPANVHETGIPYKLIQGNFADIPEITAEEREHLLNAARKFDERIMQEKSFKQSNKNINKEISPAGAEEDWQEILDNWSLEYKKNDVGYWRKPDAGDPGIHATTNHDGTDRFYCFSTSAPPFENGRYYSKAQAIALLNGTSLPLEYSLDDIGNAHRLADRFHRRFRWVEKWRT